MSTTVYIYETGFGGGASGGPQAPITVRVVLMACPSQVQHMLGKGEQDLCHLQGGEETVALHSAGHHVVRGGVSVPWPGGQPGNVGWIGFCRETPLAWGFRRIGTCWDKRD